MDKSYNDGPGKIIYSHKAAFSLYQVFVNDENLTEQKATLHSLQQQLKTVTEQVQEQEKYLSTVTDFYPSDRIVVHGEGK